MGFVILMQWNRYIDVEDASRMNSSGDSGVIGDNYVFGMKKSYKYFFCDSGVNTGIVDVGESLAVVTGNYHGFLL